LLPKFRYAILRPSVFATLIRMVGIAQQPVPLSQEMVFMPAAHIVGRVFMPKKDLPFPTNIRAPTIFLGQSFITMKSRYCRNAFSE
jgi:hypothetical protein